MEIPNYDSDGDTGKKIQTVISLHAIKHISDVDLWKQWKW